MRNREPKATTKEAQKRALVDVVDDIIEEAPVLDELPGCCAVSVACGFPTDEQVEGEVEGLLDAYNEYKGEEDPEVSEKVAEEVLLEAYADWFDENHGDHLTLVTLAQEQSKMQALVYKLGFRRKQVFEGNESSEVKLYTREED